MGVGTGDGCRELDVKVGIVVAEEPRLGACVLGG